MEENQRWALRINRKNLAKDLNVKEVEDHMIQCEVMEEDDFEIIQNSGKCRKERVGVFLDKLEKRGPTAFDYFCDALKEKQQFLSKKLKDDAEKLGKVEKGAKIEIDATILQDLLKDNDSIKQTNRKQEQLLCEQKELQERNERLREQLARVCKMSNELAQESDDMKMKNSESNQRVNTLLDVVTEKKCQKDDMERGVQNLQERLYKMDEKLNLKEETLQRMVGEKSKINDRLIQKQRMICNLRQCMATLNKDMSLLTKDLNLLKRDGNAVQKLLQDQRDTIMQLQHELMLSNNLKKNCESIIKHLNGSVQSKTSEAKQARYDLAQLLKQYIQLKETVAS